MRDEHLRAAGPAADAQLQVLPAFEAAELSAILVVVAHCGQEAV